MLPAILLALLAPRGTGQRPCATVHFWADPSLHGELVNGVGELQVQGRRHRGVLYAVQYWECLGENHMIHDIVSASDDGAVLALTYVYSRPRTGAVNYAFTETTASSSTVGFSASGGVVNATACPSPLATLPAWVGHTAAKPTGLVVQGPELYLGPSGVGWAVMTDHAGRLRTFQATVFSMVDCTDCSKECPSKLHPNGWFELHTTLAVPQEAGGGRAACFAIVYLYHDDPSLVEVTLSVCWPELDPLPPKAFRAPWTQLNSTLIFQ